MENRNNLDNQNILAIHLLNYYLYANHTEGTKEENASEWDKEIQLMTFDHNNKEIEFMNIFNQMVKDEKLQHVKMRLLGENEEIVNQISSYVDMVTKFNLEELVELINNDLRMKVYLVGPCITAANILVYAHVARYAQKMQDFEKYAKCNLSRWVYHLQSLPGLSQCAERFGLLVSFPNKKYENLSKRMLKKMIRRKTIRELAR